MSTDIPFYLDKHFVFERTISKGGEKRIFKSQSLLLKFKNVGQQKHFYMTSPFK